MLYVKELLEYIKHFPLLQLWNNGIVSDSVSYSDIYYLLEDSLKNNDVYEVQTKLPNIKYVKDGSLTDAFGIAIDIDTKDRENITIDNLRNAKEVAIKLVKEFATYGITSLLKFSGGGYHILLFFKSDLIGDYLEVKDWQNDIIHSIIKKSDIDKTIVKDIEIKHDQIRSLFSYNSKYKNYSVPSELTQPVEMDVKRSTTYEPINIDFNSLINESIINDGLISKITKAEEKKQASNKFREVATLVNQVLTRLDLSSKKNLTDSELGKIVYEIKPKTKSSPNYIIFVAKSILKYKKSITIYDTLINMGVNDGRKRLLIYVVIPYLNIKYNNNKNEMEKEAYAWLTRSGVSESDHYRYRNEINSLLNNIKPEIRPISIQSLLARFDETFDEFVKEYIRGR